MELKQRINIAIDLLMLITGVITFLTSISLYFRIYFGIPRSEIVEMHNPIGLAFAILFMLHIFLHFGWFKNLPKMILSSIKKPEENKLSN